jgi:protein TonB
MSIDSAITRQEDAEVGLRLLYRLRRSWHVARVSLGAAGGTLACFLVLPLMETIARPPDADLLVRSADVAALPPPPPPPAPEPEPEPEPETPPPQLAEPQAPLDFAQLESLLNPGAGGDWGVVALDKLSTEITANRPLDDTASLDELDQKPRIVHQPAAPIDPKLRKRTPATVYVIFTVDERGKVVDPRVQGSTDAQFERHALATVKQWKFEPGKRRGQPVRFRMHVPVNYPKS